VEERVEALAVGVEGEEASGSVGRLVGAGNALVFAEIDGENGGRNRTVGDGGHGKLQVGVGSVGLVTVRLPRPHGLHGFFRRQEVSWWIKRLTLSRCW
jgi:hypothetical protein